MRYLTLPVDDADIQDWIDRAAEKHQGGYRIETFGDDIPAELVPGLCELFGQLAVDAPTGEVDFEEEVMTPERYAERAGHGQGDGPHRPGDRWRSRPTGPWRRSRRSRSPSTTAATSGSGARSSTASTAATGSGWPPRRPTCASCRRRFPGKTRIVTQNGETNDFMVSINVLMGFELVEASAEFVKRILNRTSSPGRSCAHRHRSSARTTASTG